MGDHTSLHRPYEILITGGRSTPPPPTPLKGPYAEGFPLRVLRARCCSGAFGFSAKA